jgi:hypothetical protein
MSWLRKRAYWGGISHVRTDGSNRNSSRFDLIRKAAVTVQSVGKAARTNGLGLADQIYYAWMLGTARQYLAEAARGIGL